MRSFSDAATLLVTTLVLFTVCVFLLNGGNNSVMIKSNDAMIRQQRRRAAVMIPVGRDPTDPLLLCEGDCDSDKDCQQGLVCFQREDTEPAFGCEFPDDGRRFSSMDVCVEEDSLQITPTAGPTVTLSPSVAPSISIAPTSAPTNIGTNSWGQTWGTTDAFKFVGPPSTPAPTTRKERNDDWTWIFDFRDPRPVQQVGDNGRGGPYPLGPCEADCDSDSDCAGPLHCLQRKPGESEQQPLGPVPGCWGEDTSGKDYCVWPDGYNATQAYLEIQQQQQQELTSIPNQWQEGFCLKLYWEEGYNWQNETIERKWCISRDYYEGSPNTGKCWHGLDEIDCESDEMYINQCDHRDVRQRFMFVPVSSDEVLIQAYRDNGVTLDEDRCFHRDNRKIKLQPCNQALHNQRWFAIRGGFNQERFELSQKTQSDHCVNQDHHPKHGEVMRMHSCKKTRGPNHLTSWWVVY